MNNFTKDPLADVNNDWCYETISRVRDLLWRVNDTSRLFDPDKEWSPGTLEAIAAEFDDVRPRKLEVYI